MQTLILFVADWSGVTRFIAFNTRARRIFRKGLLGRHLSWSTIGNGRSTKRLTKPQGQINAVAIRKRIVKRRGAFAGRVMRYGEV
jgi:hypothetical protein